MDEIKKPSLDDDKSKGLDSLAKKSKNKKSKLTSLGAKNSPNSENQEVLLKLPGGFEYKMPGKRQRIVVASLVVGLNMLLLVAVGLYFYVPGFKDFIYNIGR